MKAIIENPVKLINENVQVEFIAILNAITESETRMELSTRLTVIRNMIGIKEFAYGFGSSHMWVKQVIEYTPKQQVIFVEF